MVPTRISKCHAQHTTGSTIAAYRERWSHSIQRMQWRIDCVLRDVVQVGLCPGGFRPTADRMKWELGRPHGASADERLFHARMR
jgi:hypothetical protein